MNENFLHLLWRTQRFDKQALITISGEKINVIQVGKYNKHNGPDFLEACIEREGVKWYGSVEIHIKSSDWNKHAHSNDENYKNVILHVVYENDCDIFNEKYTTPLPCLELKNKIPSQVLERYQSIIDSENAIVCSAHFNAVPEIIKRNWIERVFIMRLEEQSYKMALTAEKNTNNFDEILWKLIFRYFVSPPNHEAMVTLFESIPFQHIKRLKNNPKAIEGILMGQAGFLNDEIKDGYPKELQTEYIYQKQKLKLESLSKNIWITRSIRNAASVCIRLSQLAHLLSGSENIFSEILKSRNSKQIEAIFAAKANKYWDTHNAPDSETLMEEKKVGIATIGIIISNAILPFLFFYSRILGDDALKNTSLNMFQTLKPEKNSITEIWKNMEYIAENAAESQSLVFLKKNFCDYKLCFECAIGAHILMTN